MGRGGLGDGPGTCAAVRRPRGGAWRRGGAERRGVSPLSWSLPPRAGPVPFGRAIGQPRRAPLAEQRPEKRPGGAPGCPREGWAGRRQGRALPARRPGRCGLEQPFSSPAVAGRVLEQARTRTETGRLVPRLLLGAPELLRGWRFRLRKGKTFHGIRQTHAFFCIGVLWASLVPCIADNRTGVRRDQLNRLGAR